MHNYKLNFNQNFTSIAVSSQTGYRLFNLVSVEKIDEINCKGNENIPDIKIVERLFNSSLVLLVTESKPNTLKILNFRKKENVQNICDRVYAGIIRSVKMNRVRLVVCLDEVIYIHDIMDMQHKHSIENTVENQLGLCSLSWNSQLAYPASSTTGELQIFNADKLTPGLRIKAHETPLSALNFSPNGVLIATASVRGTVIRVFCVKNGQRVHEFRRGMKRCVQIASLVFSPNDEYICTSSNTETVHIFKVDPKAVEAAERKNVVDNCDNSNRSSSLEDISPPQEQLESSWTGYLTKAVSSYFPTQVCDVFHQDRAFAMAQLIQAGRRHVCAVAKIQKETKLLTACEDGFLYIYDFDDTKGGTCTLARAHDLRNSLDDVIELDLTECKEHTAQRGVMVEGKVCGDTSYAGVLKGKQRDKMTESDKFRSIREALETPTKTIFDDQQFPPVAPVRE